MESRIFNGEIIPHDEKTFSLYKPYTEWINKGKAGVPVELGVKVYSGPICQDTKSNIMRYNF